MADESSRKGKNDKIKSKKGLHDGHRMRLLAKLDTDGLCDHEYLEALLFNAVPRKNTNDLAHRLLFEFGSPLGIFRASYERLTQVEGVGPAVASYIRCIGAFVPRLIASGTTTFPADFTPRKFGAYAKREYGTLGEEVLDVYLLDERGKAFERRRIDSPEEGMVEVDAKWLQSVIAAGGPSGIVVVHNHPQGDPFPSRADELTTEKCQYLCNNAGIVLCDHLIYAPTGIYSYYESGRLLKIAENCALQNAGPLRELEREETK
ncbi:MAG: hypothetical protein IJX91_01090 [Clostridia bacterium]|nr:hypothetical protein [Clostridia bacterium]